MSLSLPATYSDKLAVGISACRAHGVTDEGLATELFPMFPMVTLIANGFIVKEGPRRPSDDRRRIDLCLVLERVRRRIARFCGGINSIGVSPRAGFTLLSANVTKSKDARIHLHRITRAHDKMMKRAVRVSVMVTKLKAQGYQVSELKQHARDYGCCKSLCRFVSCASLLPWSDAVGDENGKVDESRGVSV